MVERAERLVHQQHARLVCERTRERDALLLAAGELGRIALGERMHAGEREHLGHARVDALVTGLPLLQSERDVLAHRHVGKERVILEHHADVARARRQVVDRLAADTHSARRRLNETGDHAQRRRLAATRRAEQDDELALCDVEIDVLDDVDVVVALAQPFERDARHGARAVTGL